MMKLLIDHHHLVLHVNHLEEISWVSIYCFVKDELKGVLKYKAKNWNHHRHLWERFPSVTDMNLNVKFIVHCYELLKEKLISLWANQGREVTVTLPSNG
jgi:hypothetical protein